MKNIPFFQLVTLVCILLFSIKGYRDLLTRNPEPSDQTSIVSTESSDVRDQDYQ